MNKTTKKTIYLSVRRRVSVIWQQTQSTVDEDDDQWKTTTLSVCRNHELILFLFRFLWTSQNHWICKGIFLISICLHFSILLWIWSSPKFRWYFSFNRKQQKFATKKSPLSRQGQTAMRPNETTRKQIEHKQFGYFFFLFYFSFFFLIFFFATLHTQAEIKLTIPHTKLTTK